MSGLCRAVCRGGHYQGREEEGSKCGDMLRLTFFSLFPRRHGRICIGSRPAIKGTGTSDLRMPTAGTEVLYTSGTVGPVLPSLVLRARGRVIARAAAATTAGITDTNMTRYFLSQSRENYSNCLLRG